MLLALQLTALAIAAASASSKESNAAFRQSEANRLFIDSLAPGSFEIVHPFQIRDKNDRIGIDTRNYYLQASEHYKSVTFVVRSQTAGRLKLVVTRNDHLFFNQTAFRKLDANGERALHNRVENCYYQGTLAGDSSTFVALSSCNGIRGIVGFANGSAWGLWPLDGSAASAAQRAGRRQPHVLYRVQWRAEAQCATTPPLDVSALMAGSQQHRLRRHSSKQTKFVEIALVGDHSFLKEQETLEDEAMAYMLETINIADFMLARDLNVRLSVVYSELWTDAQRVDLDSDIARTLTGSVEYASSHLYHIAKDALLMFTGNAFGSSEVSIVGQASVCTARAVGLVKAIETWTTHGTGQSVAQTIAHMLGIDHDSSGCTCTDDVRSQRSQCVMAKRMGWAGAPFAWQFSKCSVAWLHTAWHEADHMHCLLNHPFQSGHLQKCGNRVVDPGEECDCGPRATCDDPCCDPVTCTLRAHAQCAAHNACCHRCELRPAGFPCRESRGVCDVAEYCTGTSGNCPSDAHLVDGTACGRHGGQCWRGNCSDSEQQCKSLWGDEAQVADAACFAHNERGLEYANCGTTAHGVRGCSTENKRCGTLHCVGGSATPTNESLKSFTFQFSKDGQHVQCKAIAESQDALVQDGTSCGHSQVCVQGSCVEQWSVSQAVVCPSNNHALQCSGHGDCSTAAACACHAGWSGVACDRRKSPTSGVVNASSSISLGPHNPDEGDEEGGSMFRIPSSFIPSIAAGSGVETTALLAILFGVAVLLVLLLLCCLLCYRRRSNVEIPQSADEKDNSFGIDAANAAGRAIKFGNMPSWREEKRQRVEKRHDRRIYGALNRITEAMDERDSLRARDSVAFSDQLAPPPDTLHNGDEDEDDEILMGHMNAVPESYGMPAEMPSPPVIGRTDSMTRTFTPTHYHHHQLHLGADPSAQGVILDPEHHYSARPVERWVAGLENGGGAVGPSVSAPSFHGTTMMAVTPASPALSSRSGNVLRRTALSNALDQFAVSSPPLRLKNLEVLLSESDDLASASSPPPPPLPPADDIPHSSTESTRDSGTDLPTPTFRHTSGQQQQQQPVEVSLPTIPGQLGRRSDLSLRKTASPSLFTDHFTLDSSMHA